MSPTPALAILVAAAALLALVSVPLAGLALVAVTSAAAVDAVRARRGPSIERRGPLILSRGVGAPLTLTVRATSGSVRVRQPAAPQLSVTPAEGDEGLRAVLLGSRRGRYDLPAAAARTTGPLGLARWHRRVGRAEDVRVYPDIVSARRIVSAIRHGRYGSPGRLTRGPLGLGTEFESVRDYLPDDDIRAVNWRATARLGRPMTNQFRVEQDRDVVCLVDAGRLMTAPLGDHTRLDEALDALTAVALVADELGDRCGAIAFDAEVLRSLRPRRRGGERAVRALFDLQPSAVDSDYELAFREVEASKRSLVLVLTDLLDEAAARSLLDAVPVLARHHALIVAGAEDPDISAVLRTLPRSINDVLAASVAIETTNARRRLKARLTRMGADVVEASPGRLAEVCVRAYVRAKLRARL